jgi:Alpha amylase, catalytic domain
MVDFGYDISDFKDVDPLFGSLADMKELIKEMHELGNIINTIKTNCVYINNGRSPIDSGFGAKPFQQSARVVCQVLEKRRAIL